ncbi:uncharacterized protein MYCFIDRAFT_178984 [Pseudocercospora fijiensis CIRAD86]|uniref:Uncharacterized protein n=1 Tax=Pseudocercospora fijiensis (strain CIRAD86) TaxID=383855 RepID=M2ZIF7_PSEFD|nr:uncharacterized protein MYCFIDRAFT_178984 [Pseudocercospora fijiensis CIRAD86]EME78899.1 hypothetical protein MYCFIDRAFT_178984 [Pseudocercospora fijiensis CIRAD86]
MPQAGLGAWRGDLKSCNLNPARLNSIKFNEVQGLLCYCLYRILEISKTLVIFFSKESPNISPSMAKFFAAFRPSIIRANLANCINVGQKLSVRFAWLLHVADLVDEVGKSSQGIFLSVVLAVKAGESHQMARRCELGSRRVGRLSSRQSKCFGGECGKSNQLHIGWT